MKKLSRFYFHTYTLNRCNPVQKRIVEKVEQLMGLCDELAAKLRKEREDSEKLMETVIKGLLESAVAGKSELDGRTPVQAAVIQLK